MLPVAPLAVLTRTSFAELEIVEEEMMTSLTTLSELPPTEPMERPWPPEQVPLVKVML